MHRWENATEEYFVGQSSMASAKAATQYYNGIGATTGNQQVVFWRNVYQENSERLCAAGTQISLINLPVKRKLSRDKVQPQVQ